MAYSVLIAGEIAAKNIDSLNKFGKADFPVGNGHVVALGNKSNVKGENDVYNVNIPANDADLASGIFYMVNEPVNVLVNGKYSGLTDDPREFNIPDGKVFTMYKPMVGDEIAITVDGLYVDSSRQHLLPYVASTDGDTNGEDTEKTYAASTDGNTNGEDTGNTKLIYVAPADGDTKLTWTDDISNVSLAYKYVGDTYVSIGNERVQACRFICVKA